MEQQQEDGTPPDDEARRARSWQMMLDGVPHTRPEQQGRGNRAAKRPEGAFNDFNFRQRRG